MPRRPKQQPPMKVGGDLDDGGEDIVAMVHREGRAIAGERAHMPTFNHNGTKAKPRTRRTDGEPVRMTSLHLPVDLLQAMRMHCAKHDTTMSLLAEEALTAHLAATRKAG